MADDNVDLDTGNPSDDDNSGDAPQLLSDWREHLPEDLSTSPVMEKFNSKGFDEVVKSYINLEQKLGGNPIIKPGENATSEQIAEYFTQLGRPDAPEGYEIGAPEDLPEGFKYDPDDEKAFRKWAYEQGISNAHAKAIWDRQIGTSSSAFKAALEGRRESLQTQLSELKQEWGSAYDEKLKMANRVARLGGEEFVEFLRSRGLHQEVPVIKMFADIGSKMSEDSLGAGKPKPVVALTPAEAQSRINKIMGDKDHPYHTAEPHSPARKEAVAEVAKLYEYVHGDGLYSENGAAVDVNFTP